MSPEASLRLYTLFGLWCSIGGTLGFCNACISFGDGPWERANWVQRVVLAVLFGPAFIVCYPLCWFVHRFIVPPATAAWRWLGRL